MNVSAGYLKDAGASLMFLFAIFFIIFYYDKYKSLPQFKSLIISVLLLCFAIDFTYTIFPEYHNTEFGLNRPTYLVILAFVTGIYLFLIYILK